MPRPLLRDLEIGSRAVGPLCNVGIMVRYYYTSQTVRRRYRFAKPLVATRS
jgi:hypothetical protein